jgi:hypothetical protein
MAQPNDAKQNLALRDHGGVNTQAVRQVIGDNEYAWLENAMPIGRGNLKVVPTTSAALVTLPIPGSCYYMDSGNISNTEYMFMFCSDGSAWQVNLLTYASVKFANAGTFSGFGTAIAQWKNERIVIIDPNNGFFDWDGTTLTAYKGTIASVSIVSGGINFTSSPTITPASGSASFSSTIGANLATLTTAGTGYAVGDLLTVVGGTFTLPVTLTVSAVTSGGVISGFNITNPGVYTIAPANNVSVTGGHGASAAFSLVFGIIGVTVANPGTGYVSAPGLTVSGGGGGTGAQLTANLAVSVGGNCISVYSGRVWIAFNRTVLFTAPGSYNDFNPADLAGSFIMTDDTLKSKISKLFSANNYLYITGGSSVNILSNVTVTAPVLSNTGAVLTPGTTVFTNTNISPSIGTEMAASVVSYFRTVAFATDYGFMGLTGSTPQKMSDALDGIFQQIDFNQGISSGQAVINNIMCLCFLVKLIPQTSGMWFNTAGTLGNWVNSSPQQGAWYATSSPLLCVYFNKKWFFATQGANIKYIAEAAPDPDVPSVYATDGTGLFKLFSDTASPIQHKIQSKLWDMGNPLAVKQAYKLGMEFTAAAAGTINISLDTESASTPYTIAPSSAGYYFTGQDATAFGNYLGMTINSSMPGTIYTGFYLQNDIRAQWVR